MGTGEPNLWLVGTRGRIFGLLWRRACVADPNSDNKLFLNCDSVILSKLKRRRKKFQFRIGLQDFADMDSTYSRLIFTNLLTYRYLLKLNLFKTSLHSSCTTVFNILFVRTIRQNNLDLDGSESATIQLKLFFIWQKIRISNSLVLIWLLSGHNWRPGVNEKKIQLCQNPSCRSRRRPKSGFLGGAGAGFFIRLRLLLLLYCKTLIVGTLF